METLINDIELNSTINDHIRNSMMMKMKLESMDKEFTYWKVSTYFFAILVLILVIIIISLVYYLIVPETLIPLASSEDVLNLPGRMNHT